jgi:hypothetical protein
MHPHGFVPARLGLGLQVSEILERLVPMPGRAQRVAARNVQCDELGRVEPGLRAGQRQRLGVETDGLRQRVLRRSRSGASSARWASWVTVPSSASPAARCSARRCGRSSAL